MWRYILDNSASKGTDLLVLLGLADRANDRGVCWPGVADTAKRARIGERAAQKALQRLRERGELRILERGGGTRRNGRGRPNRYLVVAGRSDAELAAALHTPNGGTGYGTPNPESTNAKPRPDAPLSPNAETLYPERRDGGTNKQTTGNRRCESTKQEDGERAFNAAVAKARTSSAAALTLIGAAMPEIPRRRIPDGELDRSAALLREAGLDAADAHGLASRFRFVDIERGAAMLASARRAGKPIGNSAGWVRCCIKGRWWDGNRDTT